MERHDATAVDAGTLETALAAAAAAVAVLRGPKLMVDYANPSYQQMFDAPVGTSMQAFRERPLSCTLLTTVDQVRATGRPAHAEQRLGQADRSVRVECSPGTGERDDTVVVVAVDITDQVRARRSAEERTERLSVLDHATAAVTANMDLRQELHALADSVVPELADACAIYLVDHSPGLLHGGPLYATRLVCVTDPAVGVAPPPPEVRMRLAADRPVARAAASRDVVLAQDDDVDAASWGERWLIRLNPHSLVAVPLGDPDLTAVISFAACGTRPRYRDADMSLIREITARAGLAVEHALRLQRANEVSLALQRGVLSDPADVDWVDLAVRYRPAALGLEAGGDWYDALLLPDGDLGLAVGDAVGHDLRAVSAMSQLRSMVQALACRPDADPAAVLTALNQLSTHLQVGNHASVVYGRLHRAADADGATLTWANSGHPPPLLVDAGGSVTVLEQARDPLLGLIDRERRPARIQVPPGGLLLFYTDGLIEDPARPSSDPIGDLAKATAQAGTDPEALCDRLIADAPNRDDIALMAARVRG